MGGSGKSVRGSETTGKLEFVSDNLGTAVILLCCALGLFNVAFEKSIPTWFVFFLGLGLAARFYTSQLPRAG
jgi:hypothetical protein